MNSLDFVVVGGQRGEMVCLMASRELTKAELESKRDEGDLERWHRYRDMGASLLPPPPLKTTLYVEMKGYAEVFAPTYAEAWAALFKMWSPDKPEIEGHRAIEAKR